MLPAISCLHEGCLVSWPAWYNYTFKQCTLLLVEIESSHRSYSGEWCIQANVLTRDSLLTWKQMVRVTQSPKQRVSMVPQKQKRNLEEVWWDNLKFIFVWEKLSFLTLCKGTNAHSTDPLCDKMAVLEMKVTLWDSPLIFWKKSAAQNLIVWH